MQVPQPQDITQPKSTITTTTSPSPAKPQSPTTEPTRDPRKASSTTAAAAAAAHHASGAENIIPLDSPLRTTPIHPSLPNINLPAQHTTSNINPLTLAPFSQADLKALGYEKLRSDFEQVVSNTGNGNGNGIATEGISQIRKADVEKARDEAVKMLREKIIERETKEREIEREIDEKEKIREVERKVFRKKMGDKIKDGG